MHIKYLLGALAAVPLLPILYLQGKRIRARVPKLPEATGTSGQTSVGTGTPLRLITIGESTIAGVGVATHEEGFTGILVQELAEQLNRSVHWRVYARSGYTVEMMTERLLPEIEETTPDLIVVGSGGNDAFTLNRPSQWRKQQADLIAVLQAKFRNTPILFTNMPPIKEFPAFTPLIKWTIGNLVEILGNELEELVQNYKNVYYNAEPILFSTWSERWGRTEGIEAFFSDGVHPSKLTYQIWAKDFARFVLTKLM